MLGGNKNKKGTHQNFAEEEKKEKKTKNVFPQECFCFVGGRGGCLSGRFSGHLSGRLDDRLNGRLSGRFSGRLSDRQSGRLSDRHSSRLSRFSSRRLSGYLGDRLSDRLSIRLNDWVAKGRGNNKIMVDNSKNVVQKKKLEKKYKRENHRRNIFTNKKK